MGRYDGPHFEVEKEDVVSIWVAHAPVPEAYFEENYSEEDDDAPFNDFATDFGFGFYDHDFVELSTNDDARVVPIRELLAPSSYSSSFLDAAVDRADQRGLGRSSAAYLIYNFKYDPAVTGIVESPCLRFLGVFPFNKKAL